MIAYHGNYCQQHMLCQTADLLFRFKPGLRFVAMLYAYFDEGGHPADSEVVSITSVVAPVRQWHCFSNKWDRILCRYKIQHGLHMTDFESRNGDFKDWNRNDQRTIPFISQLSSILITHMQYGCVVICSHEELECRHER